jgi:hypothetical protein
MKPVRWNKFGAGWLVPSECTRRMMFQQCQTATVNYFRSYQTKKGKRFNMKTRTMAFAFALCLVSSLALADNPSDAPLVTEDADSAAVQVDQRVGSKNQLQTRKGMSLSQESAKDCSKSEAKKTPSTPEAPTKANATSAL